LAASARATNLQLGASTAIGRKKSRRWVGGKVRSAARPQSKRAPGSEVLQPTFPSVDTETLTRISVRPALMLIPPIRRLRRHFNAKTRSACALEPPPRRHEELRSAPPTVFCRSRLDQCKDFCSAITLLGPLEFYASLAARSSRAASRTYCPDRRKNPRRRVPCTSRTRT